MASRPLPTILVAEPLTPESFAPYGHVVAARASGYGGNQGTASRSDGLAELQNARPGGATANVCVFRSSARELGAALAGTPGDEASFEVALLERHPYSSQLFVPLNAPRRYLVVVALPAAEPPGVDVRREGAAPPDMTTLRAFMARRDQGVNYAAGVWHHPLAALDGATDFACVVYEDGTPDDCHVLAMGDVGPGAPVVVRIARDAGGEAVSRL